MSQSPTPSGKNTYPMSIKYATKSSTKMFILLILIQIGFDKYNDARNNQVSNNNMDLRMFDYHSSVLRP